MIFNMATITDFQAWLDEIDLDNYDDVDSLYRSVKENDNYGLFKTEVAPNGQYIVSSTIATNKLRLASGLAKDTFLRLIEKVFCNNEPEETWYVFYKAMEKND